MNVITKAAIPFIVCKNALNSGINDLSEIDACVEVATEAYENGASLTNAVIQGRKEAARIATLNIISTFIH